MASGSRGPPPPPPPNELHDKGLDFIFSYDDNSGGSFDDLYEEEAPEGGNFIRPDEEAYWIRCAARRSIYSEAERRRKRDE
jgi:hypothetical protein